MSKEIDNLKQQIRRLKTERIKDLTHSKNCKGCNKEFITIFTGKKYCTHECARKINQRKHKEKKNEKKEV